MATRYTTWRPDTCGCEVALAWDDTMPADQRAHTVVSVVPCPLHDDGGVRAESTDPVLRGVHRAGRAVRDVSRASAMGAKVLAENQGKNLAIGALIEHAPDLKAEDVLWRLNEDRKVVLSAPSLGNRKAAAQAALNSRFGANTVTLE